MVNTQDLVTQDVQPHYYWSNTFEEVKDELEEFGRMMRKPFNIEYDFKDNRVILDRAVEFLD